MHRCVEVIERRICERLPTLVCAVQQDAPLPQFIPFGSVFLAQGVKTELAREGGQASCFLIGSVVQLAGHQAGDLTQAIPPSGASPKRVLRCEGTLFTPFGAR